MNEVMKPHGELWLDGPNYTADAIVIDPLLQKILLIERRDCGEWALPGGFVDTDESAYTASLREAKEEASVDLTDGQLVYRGIVDDPRNTEHSWIETSAYLFTCPSETEAHAGDDARTTKWFSIDALPQLYASHRVIVDRSLDVLASKLMLETNDEVVCVPVSGGHMNYGKYLARASDQTLFIKTYESTEASGEHILCLHKEAATMSHLRMHGYTHIPRASHIVEERTLVMEAFSPDDGWQWRAPHTLLDQYIGDCLEAFQSLESQPIPGDMHSIVSSFATHAHEGWDTITPASLYALEPLIARLQPDSQATAKRLLTHVESLQSTAQMMPLPTEFVFCHHDARQANIAWHEVNGARLVDWSWADIGRPGSDATTLLIDLHKHGHDIQQYMQLINPDHCLTMVGFWLEHASWPIADRASSIRLQQLLSALAAYELLEKFDN